MDRLGLAITGVDINPNAVETTENNFTAIHQKGSFVVSDLFAELNDQKFDTIFSNHTWQFGDSITNEFKTEKTFDPGYKLVERYIAEDGRHRMEKWKLVAWIKLLRQRGSVRKLLPPIIITMRKSSHK